MLLFVTVKEWEPHLNTETFGKDAISDFRIVIIIKIVQVINNAMKSSHIAFGSFNKGTSDLYLRETEF